MQICSLRLKTIIDDIVDNNLHILLFYHKTPRFRNVVLFYLYMYIIRHYVVDPIVMQSGSQKSSPSEVSWLLSVTK